MLKMEAGRITVLLAQLGIFLGNIKFASGPGRAGHTPRSGWWSPIPLAKMPRGAGFFSNGLAPMRRNKIIEFALVGFTYLPGAKPRRGP